MNITINGTILFLIFLTLKLTGVITWSWWWVACPLWIGAAIAIGVLCFAVAVVAFVSVFAAVLSASNNGRRY